MIPSADGTEHISFDGTASESRKQGWKSECARVGRAVDVFRQQRYLIRGAFAAERNKEGY